MEKVAVISGAGISAESGLKTFRDDGGLWRTYRFTDLASPDAFARQPETVLA
ncbi:MAG: NAD-dependent deacylase, partial [Desulfuromonadales bacterium]|nr:NAD-dependent deacylase [Desulfuromonadales bacterium]